MALTEEQKAELKAAKELAAIKATQTTAHYFRVPGGKVTKIAEVDHCLYINDNLSGVTEDTFLQPESTAILDNCRKVFQVAPFLDKVTKSRIIDRETGLPVSSLVRNSATIIGGAAAAATEYVAGKFQAGAILAKTGRGAIREKL